MIRALAGGLARGAGAVLAPPTAHAEPLLNYPPGSPPAQRVILDATLRTIDAAPAGSVLRIANPTYSWPVTHALVAAHNRGVSVRAVVWGGGVQHSGIRPPVQRLMDRLGADAHVCYHGCNAPGGGMHVKTLLASDIGGHPVTQITSLDLFVGLATKEWDAGHSSTSLALYRGEVRWFDSMLDSRRTTPRPYVADGMAVTNFPQPSSTVTRNWYTRTLAPVGCKPPRHARLVPFGRTHVRVATSLWSPLMRPMAYRLVTLHRQGCNVRAILNRVKTPRSIVRILRRGHVSYRYSNTPVYHSHVKEVAVDGWYGGRWVHTVAVGSTNPSIVELRNDDDNMIRLLNAPAAAAVFARQFDTIWRLGNTRPLPAGRQAVIVK